MVDEVVNRVDEPARSVELPGLNDFAQQVGLILIHGSSAEGAFQRLVESAAGVEERVASILTLHQSNENLSHALSALAENFSFPFVRDDLTFSVELFKRCSANRNLFAHGSMTNMKFGNVRDGHFSSTFCVVKRSARGRLKTQCHFFSLEDLAGLTACLRDANLYLSALGGTLKGLFNGQLSRPPRRPTMPPLLSAYHEDNTRIARTLGFQGKQVEISIPGRGSAPA